MGCLNCMIEVSGILIPFGAGSCAHCGKEDELYGFLSDEEPLLIQEGEVAPKEIEYGCEAV